MARCSSVRMMAEDVEVLCADCKAKVSARVTGASNVGSAAPAGPNLPTLGGSCRCQFRSSGPTVYLSANTHKYGEAKKEYNLNYGGYQQVILIQSALKFRDESQPISHKDF